MAKERKPFTAMSVDDLVQLNQQLGRDIDEIRDQRRQVQAALRDKLPLVPPVAGGATAIATNEFGQVVAYVMPDKEFARHQAMHAEKMGRAPESKR